VPLPFAFAYANATEANLLLKNLMFILGGGVLLLILRFLKEPASVRAAGILGVSLVVWGAYDITGDFLRSRPEITGTVTSKYVTRSFRGLVSFSAVIDGRSFPTTTEVYNRLETRSRVKAAIGQASGTIFEVTKLY
jgi:hypothetical protein